MMNNSRDRAERAVALVPVTCEPEEMNEVYQQISALFEQYAAEIREECAKVVEDERWFDRVWSDYKWEHLMSGKAQMIAKAIRALTNDEEMKA